MSRGITWDQAQSLIRQLNDKAASCDRLCRMFTEDAWVLTGAQHDPAAVAAAERLAREYQGRAHGLRTAVDSLLILVDPAALATRKGN